MLLRRYLGLVAILQCTAAVTGQEVRAYFNMSGVQGFVEFTEEGTSSTSATIYINVQRWFQWEIRELPILTTESQTCNDAFLGRSIHDLGSYRSVIDQSTVNGTRVSLNGVPLRVGDNAILGRTLLLYNGQGRACATIQGAEPVSFATVNGHIAGTIHVREIGPRYAVFTDLISTRSLQQSRTSLKIYGGHIRSDLPHAQREVIEASDRCDNNRVSSINMIAEIRDVPIAPGDGMIRFMAYVEPNTRRFDFSSGWVKVGEDPDTSCANFHQFERKTVTAMFSRDGVKGTIKFTQENPYTPTFVTVDLLNLNRQADGYHVHVYPLPYEFTSNTDLCGVESTGGHLDPFNGITTGATQELAEIGDLSTKHGFLRNKLDVNETYMDLYLPLFGKHSIVGRSLVIHAPGGSRWICANIGYPGPVTVAKSEVNGEIQGTLMFVQRVNMPWDDTSVFVEMTDAGARSEATYNHNYHIHSDPVGDDYMSTQRRCASTGEHWNPFDVAVKDKSVYNPACEINRFGCEIGDLSKKYNETVNMTSSKVSKYFYTDDLPLSSAYSIINKSITVHKEFADAARYACADIVQKLTPVVTTETQWYGLEGTATGSIQMSSSGLIGSVTALKVDLSGLDGKGDGYHIHEYPLNNRQPGSNVCGTTGGHYNPLGAIKWKNDDSFDNYEIGDLSNKFRMLNGLKSYRLQAQDSNLPLSGPYSSVGRSVVIHDPVNRWKCTNTVWDTVAMNGSLIQGYSKFTGDVQGHIQLSQVVTADGESDVSIEMMLWHRHSNTETRNHNWHIHEYSIAGTDCSTAGLHYNPFDVDISTQTYKTDCDLETPRKCEVGDLAGKLGQINIGTKDNPTRYVFNDNFLSLRGKFAVLAKSLVIHAKDSGAARIACQDIMPTGQLTEMTQYYIETPLDKHKIKEGMTAAITDSMDIFYKHIVYVGVGEEKGICTTVSVYFTGEKATELKSKFNADHINRYKPMDVNTCLSAAASAAPSLLLGLAALLFSFFTANIPH
ncbi:uncharacterized protein [Watersipora subatra]|uniref:uncharacterized protein n=1 Tax=Watersipora subatra TaxID=2589382 RepID=UPI00355AFBAA